MEVSGIIILILWAAISLLIINQYAPVCKDLSKKDRFIVGCIFIIGGPIFATANILETILDCILPEGWDDDDDGPWQH